MKATICAGYICEFREHSAGNQVIGLPDYLAKLMNNGENPFREFLKQVEPNCRVNVMVSLEALPPTPR